MARQITILDDDSDIETRITVIGSDAEKEPGVISLSLTSVNGKPIRSEDLFTLEAVGLRLPQNPAIPATPTAVAHEVVAGLQREIADLRIERERLQDQVRSLQEQLRAANVAITTHKCEATREHMDKWARGELHHNEETTAEEEADDDQRIVTDASTGQKVAVSSRALAALSFQPPTGGATAKNGTKKPAKKTTSLKRKTDRTGRPYRTRPEDFVTIYTRFNGSPGLIASHYGVPPHTSQAWVGSAKRSGLIT
jgi:uncharacterized coiled-coil protein SlyX